MNYIPVDGTTATDSKMVGIVKWFNNRHGYGFLTSLCGDTEGEDVFVHHSALATNNDQYRYLVQGEYVEFDREESDKQNSDYNWQAIGVTGIKSGKLMCETRNDMRQSGRHDDETMDRRDQTVKPPGRIRGGGPRGDRDTTGSGNDVEWRLVQVKKNNRKDSHRGAPRRESRSRTGDSA